MKESQQNWKKKELLSEIEAAEKRLLDLKELASQFDANDKVYDVPESFESVFSKIQNKFAKHFKSLKINQQKGQISINGERYLLVRSSSFSFDFFQGLIKILEEYKNDWAFELASEMMFDIAHIIGKKDAQRYHEMLDLKNDLDKLSAGPIHFAFAGWAVVEILPESKPESNDNFYLKYRHKFSFEAEAWIKSGKIPSQSVCAMSAGYSSGWCEQSFGIPLTAVEISCEARKDDACIFIMAPPSKISNYIDNDKAKKTPSFFKNNIIKEKLQEKEEQLLQAEKFSKLGTWTYYFKENYLAWSNEVYSIFDISKNENENLFEKYLSRLDNETQKKLEDKIEVTRTKGLSYEIKHIVHCPNDIKKWVVCSGQPILNNKDEIIGLKGVVQDITEYFTGSRELNHFFNVSVDLQCIANKKGYFVKVSPSWTKVLGYSEEELLSRPYLDFVHPEDKNKTAVEAEFSLRDHLTLNFENRYITKSGETVVLSWNSTTDEVTNLIYCTVRDVTKERQAKDKLLSNLSEKEILLREIHHRVKNNLQVISSLLSLQAGFNPTNPELNKLYSDSQSRIKSMAAIHEMFYKSENLDKIDFGLYIKKLISDLIHTYQGKKNNIKLDIESTKIYVNLDTAIPLGLIINEIITNALKHGFKTNDRGTIFAKFKNQSKNILKLIIGDDGVGNYRLLENQENETLGITLITSLVEQLDGEIIQLENSKGTLYEITFQQSD
ncbi:MAG: histidine kinase dimerization/phosphoacceptor domain -containing protein [Brumimicrobium sp.]